MPRIILKLYVIGGSLISKRAIKNLESIVDHPEVRGLCDIEIVDLCVHEGVAEVERVLATPLLIKKEPLPQRRIIGDLSNFEKVLTMLELVNNV